VVQDILNTFLLFLLSLLIRVIKLFYLVKFKSLVLLFTKVLRPSGSGGSNAVWVQVNGGRCPEFLRQPKGSLKIQTATQFFLLPSSRTASGRKRTITRHS